MTQRMCFGTIATLILGSSGCGGRTRGIMAGAEAGSSDASTPLKDGATAADAPGWPDLGPLGDGSAPLWTNITPPGISLSFSSPPSNYGMQVIQVSPTNPSIVYFGTCYQGIWKSTDGGDHFTKVNTGTNGPNLDTGRNWGMALDPTDPNTLYTVAGAGASQGIWKSGDGGVDWSQVEPMADIMNLSADVYDLTIDPYNHLHVLATFHEPWNGYSDAGLLETTDGGATWTAHAPVSGFGDANWVYFLGNSSTWILSAGDALWRTATAGGTWTKVSTIGAQHGAWGIYRARTGVLYAGGLNNMQRSTDDGLSWSAIGPSNSDGYYTVIGDGVYLYAQSGNTGTGTVGPQPYYVALETDGVNWRPYNGQMFSDGPMSMSIDPVHKILFSSNWDAGIWRLKTGH